MEHPSIQKTKIYLEGRDGPQTYQSLIIVNEETISKRWRIMSLDYNDPSYFATMA